MSLNNETSMKLFEKLYIIYKSFISFILYADDILKSKLTTQHYEA